MDIMAVIPARGGSKGVPGKNIKPLGGIPLLAHSIRAARGVPAIGEVIVSTDDEQIAEVASNEGAQTLRRPAEISGDFASSESALLHVLDTVYSESSRHPDILVFLQCTSPLTRSSDIEGALNRFIRDKADTLVSAAPFHYYLWTEDDQGKAVGVNHSPEVRLMRQERQNQFIENGAIYIMDTQGFLRHKHRFFGKTVLYHMDESRSFEIDEPIDFPIAEAMYAFQNS